MHQGLPGSRGIVREGHKPPPPLTSAQRDIVESWARRGRRDRVIADHLGVPEYQVMRYRQKLGIKGVANRGSHQETYHYNRDLRPSHVHGEAGSDQWFADCERAFTRHVIGVLATGGW